jgi:hypothetical protein
MLAQYALLAFGVWPVTFFFRMAYTEGPFLLIVLLALLGMQERWRHWVIALLIGLATATRPVGIALIPVLILHLWQTRAGWRGFVGELLAVLPLSCWGLLAYMAFQWGAFDDPLAFARTQDHWRFPARDPGWSKPWSLLTLEPIWNLYNPASPRYWNHLDRHGNPLFSMMAANPVYLFLTLGLVGLGWWRKWLTLSDVVLAAGLIGIPYLTRGYEMSLASFARFCAVVPGLYLVLAQLLHAAPPPVRYGGVMLASAFLVIYASLFAVGYLVF